MKKKRKEIYLILVMACLLFSLSAFCLLKRPEDYSYSERRLLAQFPRLTTEALTNGSFMEAFEAYSQDQFPFRENFRSLKAVVAMRMLQKADNNGIYYLQGQLGKLDYPLKPKQLQHALERIQYIYDTYLQGSQGKCYMAIIPDKNYYLAKKHGYPALDYEALFKTIEEQTPYLKHIDLRRRLSEKDFYSTDTHWRQECILPVAGELASAMGHRLSATYRVKVAKEDFYGVYAGQAALRVEPDPLSYLTNDLLEQCRVISYDTKVGVEKSIYDEEKLSGKDPYEFFLSGADPLLVIENPMAKGKGELIVFRDSFGSSLIPLLAEEYEKITLVDIRYIHSSLLEQFIEFNNQEVLFLYSTLLLNNSLGMK